MIIKGNISEIRSARSSYIPSLIESQAAFQFGTTQERADRAQDACIDGEVVALVVGELVELGTIETGNVEEQQQALAMFDWTGKWKLVAVKESE